MYHLMRTLLDARDARRADRLRRRYGERRWLISWERRGPRRWVARLSCPDDRFADFAASTGVEVGPLEPDERERLRAEIDARVARAWGLDAADLETIFADFTLDAVPEGYREQVRERFAELGGT